MLKKFKSIVRGMDPARGGPEPKSRGSIIRKRLAILAICLVASLASLGLQPAPAYAIWGGCPSSGEWVCLYSGLSGEGSFYLVSALPKSYCYNIPSSFNDMTNSVWTKSATNSTYTLFQHANCPLGDGWYEYWLPNRRGNLEWGHFHQLSSIYFHR